MTVAEALTPSVRQTARRLRFPLLIVVLLLVVVAIPTLLAAGGGSSREFAEDGRAPNGAGALAAVLQQQGVQLRTTSQLADAEQAGDATLLVDDQDHLLTAAEWSRLEQVTPDLVVVDPGYTILSTLNAPEPTPQTVAFGGAPTGTTVPADCDLPAARRGAVLALGGSEGSFHATSGTLCFRDAHGDGQIFRTDTDAGTVTLVATPNPFENQHIATQGNGAVALGLLGARDQLLWYVPDPLDLPQQGAPSLQQLTPVWVTPFMVMLLLAGVAAAFWRGRRLGPLVVERLPVVVRSRETVEGRARLYQRGQARLRAADALRIGALGRITPFLGLQPASPVAEVVRAAAARTGRPVAQLQALLVDAEPGDDAALVRLSDDLTALERAVRPAPEPSGRRPRTEPPA